MNSFISVPLSIIAWVFTILRIKQILHNGIRNTDTITFNICGILFFFSISFTFVIQEFAIFFDTHTLPNLSLFISNAAFLSSQYFGLTGILNSINIPTRPKITARARLLLALELISLFLFYLLFVSKTPQITTFFIVENIVDAIFMSMMSSFAIIMGMIIVITSLKHLPAKEFALLRLRTILMTACVFLSVLYYITTMVTFQSYIWGFVAPPIVIPTGYALVIAATLLFFFLLLSNRIHAQFIILSELRENWKTFQDLKQLSNRLKLLCPTIGMPLEDPSFWQFVLKPEYYLYRAVIIILDAKTIISDFLSETMEPGTPEIVWEADLLPEAIRINQIFQAANPSDNFSDILTTYRRISKDLFASQT